MYNIVITSLPTIWHLLISKACGSLSLLSVGAVVYWRTLMAGLALDSFVAFVLNSLLPLYMNMRGRRRQSAVSWPTVFDGLFRNGCLKGGSDSATMVS